MKQLKDFYSEHNGKISDKWSIYLSTYERLFRKYCDENINLLEIGVQNGGSLEIWARYFPHAERIVGCDINELCKKLTYNDRRISVVVQDANTDDAEKEILGHSPKYDIIIDDGSHRSSDIIKSFLRYFPSLKTDGLFIAEDLHCSYWREFEGGLYAPFSSIAFFKRLIDIINYEHWGIDRNREDILSSFCKEYKLTVKDASFLSEIHSIEFVDSMCIIKKSRKEDNSLGVRIVSGFDAAVCGDPSIKHGTSCEKRDQSANKWSIIDKFPEEQIEPLFNELNRLQNQVKTISEDYHLLQKQLSALYEEMEINQERHHSDRLGFERRYEELLKENQKLEKIVTSAKNWQKQPWFRRAFRKWHGPNSRSRQRSFSEKFKRSILKRLGKNKML